MKRFILSTLIATSCTTIGGSAHAWDGNWLLGGSVGYVEADGTLNSRILFLDPAGLAAQQLNAYPNISFDNTGWLFGVLGGYQIMCENWLLGLELNADWHEHYDPQDFALSAPPAPGLQASLGYQGTAIYKNDLSIGLTGRLGYALSCYFIPYLRLGVEGRRDHLEVTYGSPFGLNLGNTAFRGIISDSQYNYEFVIGIGAEIPFCGFECASNGFQGPAIRAEYIYHGHTHALNGEVVSLDPLFSPPLNDQSYSVNYKPHFNSAKISLVWNFC